MLQKLSWIDSGTTHAWMLFEENDCGLTRPIGHALTCLMRSCAVDLLFFFFQAEDGIRDSSVTGVQTCALPIYPRVVPKARRLDRIAFEEMLELASQGAKVLQVRSVELGMVRQVPIFVRSSFDAPEEIDPYKHPPGTLICDEAELVEQHILTGIAFSKHEAQISIRNVADKPGVAANIFGPLADAHINVDMIVQNVSADGATTDLTFTVSAAAFARANETLSHARAQIG